MTATGKLGILVLVAVLALAACGGGGGGDDKGTATTTTTVAAAQVPHITDVQLTAPDALAVTTDWCDGALGVQLDEKPDQVTIQVGVQGGEPCTGGETTTVPASLTAPLGARPLVDQSGKRWLP